MSIATDRVFVGGASVEWGLSIHVYGVGDLP
jgi:hypothetical protein